MKPAVKFAIKFATNQIPNIIPTNFKGANLLTYERPTGETHSSPKVWNKYAKIKKIILTEAVFAPKGIPIEPKAKIPKPNPNKINPIANLIATYKK